MKNQSGVLQVMDKVEITDKWVDVCVRESIVCGHFLTQIMRKKDGSVKVRNVRLDPILIAFYGDQGISSIVDRGRIELCALK